jgi:hypothetical protein
MFHGCRGQNLQHWFYSACNDDAAGAHGVTQRVRALSLKSVARPFEKLRKTQAPRSTVTVTVTDTVTDYLLEQHIVKTCQKGKYYVCDIERMERKINPPRIGGTEGIERTACVLTARVLTRMMSILLQVSRGGIHYRDRDRDRDYDAVTDFWSASHVLYPFLSFKSTPIKYSTQ